MAARARMVGAGSATVPPAQIRACALERGVVNCAHCADYACDKLRAFWAHAAEAQAGVWTRSALHSRPIG